MEPYQGQRNHDDRADDAKLHYVGNARVHKYYDASIFNEELKCIREGLSCEAASEREFEMALAQRHTAFRDHGQDARLKIMIKDRRALCIKHMKFACTIQSRRSVIIAITFMIEKCFKIGFNAKFASNGDG